MKKFFKFSVVLTLIAIVFACSVESYQNESQIITENVKFNVESGVNYYDMFLEMYNSELNVYFLSEIDVFYDNMNISLKEDILFESKDDILNWIDNNLEETYFENLEVATQSLNNTLGLYDVLYNEFENFFLELEKTGQMEAIYYSLLKQHFDEISNFNYEFSIEGYGGSSNDCFECINTAVDCWRAANEQAATTIAGFSITGGAPGAALGMIIAHINQGNQERACAASFEKCIRDYDCV